MRNGRTFAIHEACMSRRPWDLAFTAEPEEVAGLRRVMRLHLGLWGLHDIADEAQLCVSELVSNVIVHVGHGTPATLAVSMSGSRLRIEVHDPDNGTRPTVVDAEAEAEAGRGMALVDAISDRWGVQLKPEGKVTWCELPTALPSSAAHVGGPGVTRAEALLRYYTADRSPCEVGVTSRLSRTVTEEAAIEVMADLLHWFRAHGRDADEVLDRAQMRFEACAS